MSEPSEVSRAVERLWAYIQDDSGAYCQDDDLKVVLDSHAALVEQVAGLHSQRDDALSLLASTTDLLNSWAREASVQEAHNEKEIREVVDRLWSTLSERIGSLKAKLTLLPCGHYAVEWVEAHVHGDLCFSPIPETEGNGAYLSCKRVASNGYCKACLREREAEQRGYQRGAGDGIESVVRARTHNE